MAKVSDLFPIDVEKYIFSYVEQGEPKKTEEGGLIQDVMVFAAPSDLLMRQDFILNQLMLMETLFSR